MHEKLDLKFTNIFPVSTNNPNDLKFLFNCHYYTNFDPNTFIRTNLL